MEFRVVDLQSQVGAVARHIEGWSRDDVLAWLGRYGEVFAAPTAEDAYVFTSHCGLRSFFKLTGAGKFGLAAWRVDRVPAAFVESKRWESP